MVTRTHARTLLMMTIAVTVTTIIGIGCRLLQEDPLLFQLYKDLVVANVITAEEFWANRFTVRHSLFCYCFLIRHSHVTVCHFGGPCELYDIFSVVIETTTINIITDHPVVTTQFDEYFCHALLECRVSVSWTSSLEQSADGPWTARFVIRLYGRYRQLLLTFLLSQCDHPLPSALACTLEILLLVSWQPLVITSNVDSSLNDGRYA